MIGNLIQQTATTTGTGDFTLSTVTGKRSFNDEFGNGSSLNVFYYFISHQSANEWEVGKGHMSSSTMLVRDTVLKSSNANALVNFGSGTKDVVCDFPAEQRIEKLKAEEAKAKKALEKTLDDADILAKKATAAVEQANKNAADILNEAKQKAADIAKKSAEKLAKAEFDFVEKQKEINAISASISDAKVELSKLTAAKEDIANKLKGFIG